MEFVGIFRNNNIWKAYLPKTSICEANCLGDTYPVLLLDPIQILVNLTRFLTYGVIRA